MKPDKDLTAVVFRVWNQWAGNRSLYVFALFPEIDEGGGLCSSYEHVGQHGAADYQGCIARTTPATPAEYADLRAELEGLGYNLRIMKRRVRK
mgnify:CR=1 FL=1